MTHWSLFLSPLLAAVMSWGICAILVSSCSPFPRAVWRREKRSPGTESILKTPTQGPGTEFGIVQAS